MKPEEAIERLEYLESALDGYPPETGINDVFAAIDTAIKALEEIQQYREIGTVEECREAVEKQKAKNPVKDKYHHNCCPNCGAQYVAQKRIKEVRKISDDLISRKALLEEIDLNFIIPILKINMREEHKAVLKILEIIMNMPTAFDKERVIEELKNKAEDSRKYWSEFDDEDAFGEMNAYTRAIEIVEKGGIE